MTSTLEAPMLSFLENQTHRMASLIRATRVDGQVFTFTDHDAPLTRGLFTYTPAGAWDLTATRKATGLRPQNAEFTGAIASDAITVADLRAKRWIDAQLDLELVDWLYPWAGVFETRRLWVHSQEFDGELYTLQVEGIARWLRPEVGDQLTRNCPYDVGDGNCGANINATTQFGKAVNDLPSSPGNVRSHFGVSGIITTFPDGDEHFRGGKIRWISGANAGIVSEIKRYDESLREFYLQLPTPFDIEIGDTCDIEPGCDKTFGTCVSRYARGDAFGGYPHVPTTNRTLQVARNKG